MTLLDRYVPDEELALLFEQSDLVVLPYLSVTTSAALGRAIGHGVPLVVSEVGDLGDIVREHSIGGVAEPGNPATLARAIIDSLEPTQLELYRQNVDLMRESAGQSWDQLVAAIEDMAMP